MNKRFHVPASSGQRWVQGNLPKHSWRPSFPFGRSRAPGWDFTWVTSRSEPAPRHIDAARAAWNTSLPQSERLEGEAPEQPRFGETCKPGQTDEPLPCSAAQVRLCGSASSCSPWEVRELGKLRERHLLPPRAPREDFNGFWTDFLGPSLVSSRCRRLRRLTSQVPHISVPGSRWLFNGFTGQWGRLCY